MTSFIGEIDKIGAQTIGSRAVTGIGTASVVHQVAMSKATPKTCHALSLSPSIGDRVTKHAKAISIPIISPTNGVDRK